MQTRPQEISSQAAKVETRSEAIELLRILSRNSRQQAEPFFARLLELLPAIFGAEIALVVELVPGGQHLRSAAFSQRGRRHVSAEYALAGSAAFEATRVGHLFIANSVRQTFPQDAFLLDWGLEAYHAVALVDALGVAVGVLAIGHSSRFDLGPNGELWLELLGQRASMECKALCEVCAADSIGTQATVSEVAASAHSVDGVRIPGPGEARIPREMLGALPVAAEPVATHPGSVGRVGPVVKELDWYRRYFELGTPGMALVGLNGDIWDANESLCEMLRRPRSVVLTAKWTELTHADDLVEERKSLVEMVEGRSDGYRIDKRLSLPDGSTVLANVTVRCARAPSRRVEFLTLLVQDLTQQRLLEQQLLHSQKLEAVGRLAGGIAHDFNNLLTAILTYTDMTRAENVADVSEMLSAVRGAAERAANLTSQLLAFARRQVIEPKVLDLNRLVQSTTHLLRRVVGEDIEIVTGIASELWNVRLDPGQVEQILVNMAVNARDAMPKGGRLLIGTGNVPSHMAHEVLGQSVAIQDYVLVIIADTGQGMDPDTIEHLFEPFFTTKEPGKGSGLGLATCHGIVSQNGGQIRVTSSLGYGTTFRIYFPRYSAEAVSAPSVLPSSPTAAVDETILLVEDDEMVRRVAVRVLKKKGYNVLSAASGVDALEVAKNYSGSIDLLLTDLVMPKMNGDRLARELMPLRPTTRVLFTSGYAESAHDHGLGPGVNFLQKPYTPRQLSDRVRKILDK
jgi:two-component system, cell cycle sensor histidine kinase and response regulator CckA